MNTSNDWDYNGQKKGFINIQSFYDFHYVIGIGGFGKVWKVQSKKNHKSYAMKEISKALVIAKKSVSSVMNERILLGSL